MFSESKSLLSLDILMHRGAFGVLPYTARSGSIVALLTIGLVAPRSRFRPGIPPARLAALAFLPQPQ